MKKRKLRVFSFSAVVLMAQLTGHTITSAGTNFPTKAITLSTSPDPAQAQ